MNAKLISVLFFETLYLIFLILEEDEFDEIIPLKDDAKLVLKGHSNVVLSVICDSKNTMIFTGGMDDTIIVWDFVTGKIITTLIGHCDSVTNMSLDLTDTYLVSGDLQGLVIVWQIISDGKNTTFLRQKSMELSEIIDIKWVFSKNDNDQHLFICDKTGTVQEFILSSIKEEGYMTPSFYGQGKGCCCNGFNVILDGQHVAVLYGGTCGAHEECSNTNQLEVCDMRTYAVVKSDLNAIANEEEDNDEGLGAGFATQRSGSFELIVIGDWSQLILARVFDGPQGVTCKLDRVPIKDGGLVTNVAFSDAFPFVAFATKNGIIGVYDITHNRTRHLWNYTATVGPSLVTSGDEDEYQGNMTVSQLKWNAGKPQFFTTGLDGRMCAWDSRTAPTKDNVLSWWGHSGIVWDLCVPKNGNCVITVSEDQTGRVFEI